MVSRPGLSMCPLRSRCGQRINGINKIMYQPTMSKYSYYNNTTILWADRPWADLGLKYTWISLCRFTAKIESPLETRALLTQYSVYASNSQTLCNSISRKYWPGQLRQFEKSWAIEHLGKYKHLHYLRQTCQWGNESLNFCLAIRFNNGITHATAFTVKV